MRSFVPSNAGCPLHYAPTRCPSIDPAQLLALEMLVLMLKQPSADSVEMACEFVKEVGAYLQDVSPQGLHG